MSRKPKQGEAENQAAATASQQIYVGPGLSNGRLPQYKIFLNGIPTHLSDIIAANPDIVELIIPIGELNSIRELIKEVGTPQQIIYEKLKGV